MSALLQRLMRFYKDNPEFSRIEVKISFEGTEREVIIEGLLEPTGNTLCSSASAQEGKGTENSRRDGMIAVYNICDEAETRFLDFAMNALAALDAQKEDQS